jgi:hypothetical protein
MREESIEKMSKSAFSNGYRFKPINVYGPEDRARIENNVGKMFSDQIMNDIMLYNVVDRLTYVRDYNVRKSINFMMAVKDKKGETIAYAEMLYSKSSEILYVKKFKIEPNHSEKEVLSLAISGAKDHLNDFGMEFTNIITSPQVDGTKKDLEIMMDMGMKFMAFTPKTDYGELSEAKENVPSEKNEIVLFPFKEQIENIKPSNLIVEHTSKISSLDDKTKQKKEKEDKKEIKDEKKKEMWNKSKKLEIEKEMLKEMHVLLIKKYGKSKMDINQEKFKLFLDDVKDEEKDLNYLYNLFKKDSDVKITLKKMDEIEKLLLLFNNWHSEDEKEEQEEDSPPANGKNIDKGIMKLIKDFSKGLK